LQLRLEFASNLSTVMLQCIYYAGHFHSRYERKSVVPNLGLIKISLGYCPIQLFILLASLNSPA